MDRWKQMETIGHSTRMGEELENKMEISERLQPGSVCLICAWPRLVEVVQGIFALGDSNKAFLGSRGSRRVWEYCGNTMQKKGGK